MVDVEGGSIAVERVAADTKAVDASREGQVTEGRKEAFVSESRFAENTVKIPIRNRLHNSIFWQ